MNADRAFHLFTVLRMATGAEVSLFNPSDGEYSATIQSIGKRSATVEITAEIRSASSEPSQPEITLYFAAVKRDAMDMITEKCTELGVCRFQPIITDHTVAGRVGTERLRAIALAAAEQSGRLSVPIVFEPLTLSTVLANPAEPILVCCEAGEASPILSVIPNLPVIPRVGILIGPEGGFSAAEFDEFAQLGHLYRVTMGQIILRCDTAAVAAVAIVTNGLNSLVKN